MQLIDPSGKLSQRDLRALLFQLVYALEGYQYNFPLDQLLDIYNAEFELGITIDSPIAQAIQAIVEQRAELDKKLIPYLANWRLERLGVPTKLILRIALWELINTDTDHKIIINEAIELAKAFAEVDAYKFINGVLDEYNKSQKK
ncbi:MAG: transcription antitermination factor NusB [Candidatus Babeliales bacterium]